MGRSRVWAWVATGLVWAAAGGVSAAFGASPAQVAEAIEKAKEYIYKQQKNGTWNHLPSHQDVNEGGQTAISVYALLAAGESPRDPRLVQAIEYLKKAELKGTYASGFRSLVWDYLPGENSTVAARDRELLTNAMTQSGTEIGLYGYSLIRPQVSGTSSAAKPANFREDMSNSQIAVLGLWGCAQAGAEIKMAVWETLDKGWRAQQLKNGAWSYIPPSQKGGEREKEARLSMSLAGTATLFITSEALKMSEGAECKGNPVDPAIENAMKYLDGEVAKAFKNNFAGSSWKNYALYGVERVGVASGYKYFGKTDWYEQGADYLIKTQRGGGWTDNPNTCFGLLFLEYGRAPVIMNKLQYTLDGKNAVGNWNERPRDVANFTRWFSKKAEKRHNWQIVSLGVAPVDDLLDAPIVYLSGNQDPKLPAAEEAKLKEYVERGGMILGNADCTSKNFVEGFKKLGARLFPKYEFRELPADHPVYTKQQFKPETWRKQQVLGLSNGVRELMVLMPSNDIGRQWQMHGNSNRESFELPANLALYATDKKNLRFKGETYVVNQQGNGGGPALKVARLEYAGNWDPEPAGWPRLAAILHNEKKLSLTTEAVKLGEDKLKNFKVAHMTGTTAMTLGEAERAELKAFVDGGGTLIVDAAGGSAKFLASIEGELAKCLDMKSYKTLEPTHAMYKAGGAAEEIEYRRFARETLIGQLGSPRIHGLEVNGKVRVFVSPEDISGGLVGEQMDGIVGFSPKTSATLMGRMLVYASGN